MLKSSVSPLAVQTLFDSASNAAEKGQAQWFTPLEWARVLSLPLNDFRPIITDLTCGNGQLLAGAKAEGEKAILLGCDIDPSGFSCHGGHSGPNAVSAVNADITRFYPLLCSVNWKCDLFVLNPPWDLHWYRDCLSALAESECPAVREAFAAHDGRTARDTIDSTIATLGIALDRSSSLGEGFLVGNEATLQRLLFAKNAPHRALVRHVWAHIAIEGNICQRDAGPNYSKGDFQTGVLWFARGHSAGPAFNQTLTRSDLNPDDKDMLGPARRVCMRLKQDRMAHRHGPMAASYLHTENTKELWLAAKEEHLRKQGLSKAPPYNIWLEDNGGRDAATIRTYLNLFNTASGRVDKAAAAALHALNGRQPIQLVVQRSQRKALEDAVKPGSPWLVDPALQRAVETAIVEYNRVRAPLYPLPKIQRLGYLDEQDDILCCKNLGGPFGTDFVPGRRYPIRSTTVATKRAGTKINNLGLPDEVEWNGQELAFFITDGNGVERCFMEGRLRDENVKLNLLRPGAKGRKERDLGDECAIDFTLQELITHFVIPEVPDVATRLPQQYEAHRQTMHEITRLLQGGHGGPKAVSGPSGSFRFKQFQLDDYARAALHDGVILGHDTGLGKTIAMFIWPLLKTGFRHGALGAGETARLTPNAPVLLVVPGDGHDQTDDEFNKHFTFKGGRPRGPVRLDSQATFYRLAKPDPRTGRWKLPPDYYLTSYTQLTGNGVADFPELSRLHPERTMSMLNLTEADAVEWWNRRGEIYETHYERLKVNPDSTLNEILASYANIRRTSNQVVVDLAFESLKVLEQVTPTGQRDDASYEKRFATLKRFNAATGHTASTKNNVTRIEGRKGQGNGFVEFQNEATGFKCFAKKSGEFWFVGVHDGDLIRTDLSFPEKAKAVMRAERLANGTAHSWEKLTEQQQQFIRSELVIARHREFSQGIGETRCVADGSSQMADGETSPTPNSNLPAPTYLGIKCVYSPSLADLCADSFSACVIDEGTKIKGDHTLIGTGVRQINAEFRLVLTATPIKNRFPDLFHLAHYVSGGHDEPTARFPYGKLDKQDFAEEFLVSERNLTKEENSMEKRRFVKFTPQVCNVHRAWKLLAPIILRRRKDDCGEDIVPKLRHVVRVPMGLSQAAAYQFHLKAKYLDINMRPAVGAKLQALRIAAANATSELLTRPEHDVTPGNPRSHHSYIPKVASTLELIRQVLERGEQCLVFSAFQNGLDLFSARLNEAGVRHLVLDGRLSQKRRGELARRFKQGPPRAVAEGLIGRAGIYPVALAGAECMAELHSFNLCNNVILTAYSWAFDKFEQGINRAHRLNSPWPVNVWSVICDGSIDRKLEAGIHEKKDAAELILDGHLLGETPEEVNLHELLRIAQTEFKSVKTMDEVELEQGWPRLRVALGKAILNWKKLAAREIIQPKQPPIQSKQILFWRQRFIRPS